MPAPTDFEIGSTLGGMVTLANLSPPVINPQGEFEDVAELVTLGSGVVRGLGFPIARWHYGFIVEDQYDELLTFTSAISTPGVFIATRLSDGSFLRYTCIMTIPVAPLLRAGRYIDITIEFTNLIEAE